MILKSGLTWFERWLSASEKNAAGRMSIYRIIYGLFYITQLPALSSYYLIYGLLPTSEWRPVASLAWMQQPPPPILFQILPLMLAFALVLVTAGLWTRPALGVVLICGVFLGAMHYSFQGKIDHGDAFMRAFIPALMLFSRWDSNYSVNALLRSRHTGQQVAPENPSWTFIWPMRAIVLLLALLFLGAGLVKIAGGWMWDFDRLLHILQDMNRKVVLRQYTPNPLVAVMMPITPLMIGLQYSALLSELLFPLSIINQRLRGFFFATMVLMHFFIHTFLFINFYSMLIAYAIAVDWEAVLGKALRRIKVLERLPVNVIIIGSLLLASMVTIVAFQVDFRQQLPLSEIGLWVAAPIALFWLVRSGSAILRTDVPTIWQMIRPRRVSKQPQ